MQLDQPSRREIITLVGGALAWPLAARAQQVTGMRRVAFLHPYAENDAEVLARVIPFREGLEALGWTENRNIRIDNRYSGGELGRIRAYATELVHSAPHLLVGSGGIGDGQPMTFRDLQILGQEFLPIRASRIRYSCADARSAGEGASASSPFSIFSASSYEAEA